MAAAAAPPSGGVYTNATRLSDDIVSAIARATKSTKDGGVDIALPAGKAWPLKDALDGPGINTLSLKSDQMFSQIYSVAAAKVHSDPKSVFDITDTSFSAGVICYILYKALTESNPPRLVISFAEDLDLTGVQKTWVVEPGSKKAVPSGTLPEARAKYTQALFVVQSPRAPPVPKAQPTTASDDSAAAA
mgnify:FL=1